MTQIQTISIQKQMLLFLLFLAFLLSANGQTYTLADTTKVKELTHKGYTFFETNPDSTIFYAEKALAVSKAINFPQGIARCLGNVGLLYSKLGNIPKAKKYMEEGIMVSDQHQLPKEKAAINNNLAGIYNSEGNYQKGLEIGKNNLAIYISLKDTNGIARSYGNIARALSFMNFFQEAREYLFKSLDLFTALKKTDRVATRLNDIAESYLAQDSTGLAKPYLFQSLTLCHQIGNRPDTYYASFNLGLCYELEKNNDSAFYYYKKCMELGEELNSDEKLQYAWNGLGAMYLKVGNLNQAEPLLLKGLKVAEMFNNTEIMRDANLSLGDLYAQKGDFQQAFRFLQKGVALKDTLLNEDKIKEIAQLSAKLEIKEMEMKNKYLQEENELQRLRLFQKNIIIAATIGSMLFLLILGFMMMRHNRMKTRQQHLELEQKQLRAQMNPHFIFNCLNSIQHYMVYNDIKNANKYLTEFASLMRKTLDILGNDSISLTQEKDYLDNYLLLEQMRFDNHFTYQIEVDKKIDMNQVEIPPMIIQPFAENAIRHGFQYLENEQQGKLSISFQEKGKDIICTIDDNGIGREKAQSMKSKTGKEHQSVGIDLTKQRLELMNKLKHIGYDLKLIDKQNEQGNALGTQVIIKIPKESW